MSVRSLLHDKHTALKAVREEIIIFSSGVLCKHTTGLQTPNLRTSYRSAQVPIDLLLRSENCHEENTVSPKHSEVGKRNISMTAI